ncbi:hypothetical protein CspeluHIS016_0701580 [Cutaneotrichosporon spelunceum]|uniref:Uncharacterized protein n=1 Tax=Cutaneotrichosporon spelunceum TaxID=1672016 RepID=A0AAD3TYA5_9TREE|nr:hypothetical protein CspeluHIS016_0701580 [Cutaneotrichosporon spelunceum]
MLSRFLRPRAAPSLASHGPGRPPPRRSIAAALAVDRERDDGAAKEARLRASEGMPRRSDAAEPARTSSSGSASVLKHSPSSPPPITPSPSQPTSLPPRSTPRQKMPRGGARARPIVDGEPSRQVGAFPRLESGRGAVQDPVSRNMASTSTKSRSSTVGVLTVDTPYDGARGYRGTTTSDTDARVHAVSARLERDHSPRPESSSPSAPTAAPRLAPPTPSVIHTLLPCASRASAAAALAYLEMNPSKLNPAAVAALDTWAYRTNDEHTRKRLRLLARAEGVRAFAIDHGRRWNRASWKLERRGHRRPNKFLWQKYPLLAHNGGGARDLLRHQHARLLSGRGYALEEMLDLLNGMQADAAHRLGALHLALAYANAKQVTGLLDAFTKHPHGARVFSRQTLHLAVLTRLRRPTRLSDVRKLLARFTCPPGPETWRHIAKHALARDDAPLAALAFDGAKAELGARRAAAARDPEPKPFTPISAKSDAQTRRQAALEAGRATAADPPPARFLHIGKHTTRWNFLLHACADRGWAVRGPSPEDESPVPRLLRRWTWLGEEGSFERRTDLVPEAEAEARARQLAMAVAAVSSPTSKSSASEGDTTPPRFGLGLGRRVLVDGTAYRVQKHPGRKVAITSWMRRRSRVLQSRALRAHPSEHVDSRRADWDDWDAPQPRVKVSGVGKGKRRK